MTPDPRPDPAQPFTDDEIAAMREAADEDRHLARVVATHDALTARLRAAEEKRAEALDHVSAAYEKFAAVAFSEVNAERARAEAAEEERDRIARQRDRWKWAHGERIVRLKAERDALQSRYEGERDRADAIQRARQRTEEECERRVREAELRERKAVEREKKNQQDEQKALRYADQMEHSTAAAYLDVFQRAGRLHALLIEARDDWLPSIEAFDGQDDGPAVFYAKVDAELLATADPPPEEGE